MNSREKENIQKLEEVFRTVHLQAGDSTIQPDVRWQNSVMREIRHLAAPEASDGGERFSLLWPVAQLAAAVVIALGAVFVTDESLTSLDMAAYQSELNRADTNLVSYYSF